MLRNLTLTRPLAALDCETTGLLDSDPRIVELAIVRVHPDLSVEAQVWRLDPGCPIPTSATAIHGIDDRAVYKCPRFGEVCHEITSFVWGCDVTGFNLLGYDLPVLDMEYARAELFPICLQDRCALDSMRAFHHFYPPPKGTRGLGTLRAACHRYLGGAFPGAHGALCDALAALMVLDAQVGAHGLPGAITELSGHDAFCTPSPRSAYPVVREGPP
jgi:DNA polymerase-3 subunit epsilon